MPDIRVEAATLRAICEETGLSEQSVKTVLLAAARHRLSLSPAQGELFGGRVYHLLVVDAAGRPAELPVARRLSATPKRQVSLGEPLTENLQAIALVTLGPGIDVPAIWREFLTWHIAHSVGIARMPEAWENWCLKAKRIGRLPTVCGDDGLDLERDYLRERGYDAAAGSLRGEQDSARLHGGAVDEGTVRFLGGGDRGPTLRAHPRFRKAVDPGK